MVYIYADSSQTVIEHHRSFIPSTLVSQLEEKENPGQPPGIKPRASCFSCRCSDMTTELRLPIATPVALQLLWVIDNPILIVIPKLMLKESTRIIKSQSIGTYPENYNIPLMLHCTVQVVMTSPVQSCFSPHTHRSKKKSRSLHDLRSKFTGGAR